MHTRHGKLRIAALAGLALLALSGAALAQPAGSPAQPESEWGYALSNELMSPWCPGFALPDCSSHYAQELRLWILEQERLGRSEEEVRADILAKYGEKMLQAPRAEGRGILAYAIPAALILAGLGVLVAFLRKQGRSAAPSSPGASSGPAAVDSALLSRVDRELEDSSPAS